MLVLNDTATVVNKILKKDDGWYVYSEDGSKKLGGPYASKKAAQKRLAQIEHFKTHQFASITFNLKAAKVRHDRMNGRPHLVVPCVMMTEGVHEGSQGPLFYPREELEINTGLWNNKPVVVYHPVQNGSPVSACDPLIIDKYGIGVLMNARWEGEGLKAECWLEEDKTKQVDNRVLDALDSEEVMEVSTGLFMDLDPTEGEWNGESYSGIARNHRPDHLAILPDQKGACSVEDGAGLLRNAAEGDDPKARLAKFHLDIVNELSQNDLFREISDLIRAKVNKDSWVEDIWDGFFIYHIPGSDPSSWYQQYEVTDNDVKLVGIRVAAEKETRYKLSDGTYVGNAAMKTDGGAKYPASAYAYVPDPSKPSTWKIRLWETPAKKETAAQVGRAIAAIGKGFRGNKAQIPAADRPKVKAKIRAAWKRTNPNKKASQMPPVLASKEVKMNEEERKELVDKLIAHAKSPYSEEDRESLMEMEEDHLKWVGNAIPEDKPKPDPKLADKGTEPEPKPAPKPTGNTEGEEEAEPTVEEYIAKAPKGIQDMLRSGVTAHVAAKAKLIEQITANSRNPFTKEQLEAKGMVELTGLAQLAEVPAPAPLIPAPHFGGQAPVAHSSGTQEEEPLVAPTMNWDKDKDK